MNKLNRGRLWACAAILAALVFLIYLGYIPHTLDTQVNGTYYRTGAYGKTGTSSYVTMDIFTRNYLFRTDTFEGRFTFAPSIHPSYMKYDEQNGASILASMPPAELVEIEGYESRRLRPILIDAYLEYWVFGDYKALTDRSCIFASPDFETIFIAYDDHSGYFTTEDMSWDEAVEYITALEEYFDLKPSEEEERPRPPFSYH